MAIKSNIADLKKREKGCFNCLIKYDISVKIGGLLLKNPVMPASGTFGIEYEGIVPIDKLGAIITKGITKEPKMGNPPPRICEVKGGILNSVGLENPGIEVFLKDVLPSLKRYNIPIIANIAGASINEYEELAERLDRETEGIEVNISCPNVSEGGIEFGKDPRVVFSLVERIRKKTHQTMIVKLSPHVSDIGDIAKASEDGGADAISLINTLKGLSIDIERQRPVLFGGLSGPAIKPIALRMIFEVYNVVSIPIIGIGGIMTPSDAIEFFLAGASAVEVGTANFINPLVCIEIIDGIKDYMERNGISHLSYFKKIRDEMGGRENPLFHPQYKYR